MMISSTEPFKVFTIGHSRHSITELAALLQLHGVVTLIDVRSSPSSRANPQHSKEVLNDAMAQFSIGYQWRKVLGGREERDGNLPHRLLHNEEVVASIHHVVTLALGIADETERDGEAAAGVERGCLDASSRSERHGPIAMMCSEAHWRECHRQYLAAYSQDCLGVPVAHILPDGKLEPHPTGWVPEFGQCRMVLGHRRAVIASSSQPVSEKAINGSDSVATKARPKKNRLQ
jgi:uncharacterized protein (DUF488 family)